MSDLISPQEKEYLTNVITDIFVEYDAQVDKKEVEVFCADFVEQRGKIQYLSILIGEVNLGLNTNASRPIIYINHFDFSAVDALIQEVADVLPNKPEIYEYNDAFGYVDFQWKNPQDYNETKDLANFLTTFYETEEENFLVLKDIHFHLENPKIIALLKAIALKTLNPKQEDFNTIFFIVASKLVIPTELEKLITVFDFPLLQQEQIAEIIRKFAQELEFTIEKDVVEELAFFI